MTCWNTFKKWISLITVEPVLFSYMMIIFIETTVLQDLIFSKACLNALNTTDSKICKNDTKKIEEESSQWFRYYNSALFLFTFITTFYVGSWTDKFGRKIVMLLPPVGSFLASINNIMQAHFIYLNVWYLLLSAFISGITAGSVAIIATTFGYIADITTEYSRTKRIVILEAMIFIGGTVGSYIAGGILKSFHSASLSSREVAFLLEMAVCAFIIFYIIFRLPYSRSEERIDDRSMYRNLFSLSHIVEIVKTVCRPREDAHRRNIILLLSTLTLIYYGQAVQFLVLYLFVRDEPLNWDSTNYSYFNGLNFAVEGIALLFGLPVAYLFCHLRDTTVGILGISSRMFGLILLGISYNEIMMFMCPLVFIFSEFSVPAIRSMLSKIVDETEKGKIFACTSAIQNICFLTGALIFNSLYPVSRSFFKGLCFEIVAFLQFIALIILSVMHFEGKRNENYRSLVADASVNEDDDYDNDDGNNPVSNVAEGLT